MIKILFNSFTFKRIFSLKDHKGIPFFFYFLIIILITSFPMNFQLVKNDGWEKLTSTTIELRTANLEWFPSELPSDGVINSYGLDLTYDTTYHYSSILSDNKEFLFIINPVEENKIDLSIANKTYYTKDYIINIDDSLNKTITYYSKCIIMAKKNIYYYYNTDKPMIGNYSKVDRSIFFNDLKSFQYDGKDPLDTFLNIVDGAFNKYLVLSNVLVNTLTQLALNTILIFVISLIFLLIRIKYKKVCGFTDNLKIVISSMTIPSIISFVVGMLNIIELNSFTVVLFQFLTPLIAMGAIYKGSGIKVASKKHL